MKFVSSGWCEGSRRGLGAVSNKCHVTAHRCIKHVLGRKVFISLPAFDCFKVMTVNINGGILQIQTYCTVSVTWSVLLLDMHPTIPQLSAHISLSSSHPTRSNPFQHTHQEEKTKYHEGHNRTFPSAPSADNPRDEEMETRGDATSFGSL